MSRPAPRPSVGVQAQKNATLDLPYKPTAPAEPIPAGPPGMLGKLFWCALIVWGASFALLILYEIVVSLGSR